MKKAKRIIAGLITFIFIFNQAGFAQGIIQLDLAKRFNVFSTPQTYRPVSLRYFSYNPTTDNFQILLDKGSLKENKTAQIKEEGQGLLKYFLIGVSLPDDKFWVNLRPDRADQIIDSELAKTDFGKVLLEADLQLKKDVAQFTSPQTKEGRAYWDKLYKKAGEIFGADNTTIPTLTRPWIVPGEVIIRENANSAYIYKATLKVMLEQDHLKNSADYNFSDPKLKTLNEYSSELVRQIIIPQLTKEVNSSPKYAALRQIFQSLILARWFKAKFAGQNGVYSKLINSGNLTGLTSQSNWSKMNYFEAYKKSFSQGEYNIKEQVTSLAGPVVRTYFSGGGDFTPKNLYMPQGLSSASPLATFNGENSDVTNSLGNNLTALSGSPSQAQPVPDLEATMVTKGRKSSSPLENKEFTPVTVPNNFAPALDKSLAPFGLQATKVEVLPLTPGAIAAQNMLLSDSLATFALGSSISQAFGSVIYAGKGKEVKEVGDGNAVQFTKRSIQRFTEANPNIAIVVLADEGARDDSYSLDLGAIYHGGTKIAFGGVHTLYEKLNSLRKNGTQILYFVGDALEKTNGLIVPEALTGPTDSTSVFSFFVESPDARLDGHKRFLINDNFRIAGVSFSAPDNAGVNPLDLPSVALPKIAASNAKAKGLVEGSDAFNKFVVDYINHTTVVALGPRPAGQQKGYEDQAASEYEKEVAKNRHRWIIYDARKLQERFPGMQIRLPGDGDFFPRAIASLGVELGGRHLVVFGRSGSAEATAATIITANIPNAQFAHTFVSNDATAKNLSPETAYQYSKDEQLVYKELDILPNWGLLRIAIFRVFQKIFSPKTAARLHQFRVFRNNPDLYQSSRSKADIVGRGYLAVTSVTGASADNDSAFNTVGLFPSDFADNFQRLNFTPNEDGSGIAISHTTLVTPQGAFIVRTTFQTSNFGGTLNKIQTFSHPARKYLEKASENPVVPSLPEYEIDIRWRSGNKLTPDHVKKLNITRLVISGDENSGCMLINGGTAILYLEKVTRDGQNFYMIVPRLGGATKASSSPVNAKELYQKAFDLAKDSSFVIMDGEQVQVSGDTPVTAFALALAKQQLNTGDGIEGIDVDDIERFLAERGSNLSPTAQYFLREAYKAPLGSSGGVLESVSLPVQGDNPADRVRVHLTQAKAKIRRLDSDLGIDPSVLMQKTGVSDPDQLSEIVASLASGPKASFIIVDGLLPVGELRLIVNVRGIASNREGEGSKKAEFLRKVFLRKIFVAAKEAHAAVEEKQDERTVKELKEEFMSIFRDIGLGEFARVMYESKKEFTAVSDRQAFVGLVEGYLDDLGLMVSNMLKNDIIVGSMFWDEGVEYMIARDSLKRFLDGANSSAASSALSSKAERKPVAGGNWKMAIKSEAEAVNLATSLAKQLAQEGDEDEVERIIAPSVIHIPAVATAIAKLGATRLIKIAAQNMYAESKAAFTNGISAAQLKEYGITHVLLGHSEVRRNSKQEPTGESNANVRRKVQTAFENDLTPIVCVGESMTEKKAGKTKEIIKTQIEESLFLPVTDKGELDVGKIRTLIVAYEPVWAIGTGVTPTPEEAQDIHRFIRELLSEKLGEKLAAKIRILYGGSVTENNIDSFMAQPDIDGPLVGGASLKADSFSSIVKSVADSARASSAVSAERHKIDLLFALRQNRSATYAEALSNRGYFQEASTVKDLIAALKQYLLTVKNERAAKIIGDFITKVLQPEQNKISAIKVTASLRGLTKAQTQELIYQIAQGLIHSRQATSLNANLLAEEIAKQAWRMSKAEETVGLYLEEASWPSTAGYIIDLKRKPTGFTVRSITPHRSDNFDHTIYFSNIAKQVTAETPPKASSALNAEDDMGGIDFRKIPIITQPMGNFIGMNFNLPKLNNAAAMDIGKELQQIHNLLEARNMPHPNRFKEVVAASYQNGQLRQYTSDISACLLAFCQLTEEEAIETPKEIKEVILILDSAGQIN